MLLFIALLAVAATSQAQNPWNNSLIGEMFINLGAVDHRPSTFDCNRYASLFRPDATLHSPGIPDSFNRSGIIQNCEDSHSRVAPLLSYQELNIPVTSWNTEKRMAMRWTINGISTVTKDQQSGDAISCVFMDADTQIQTAWSFYDDRLFPAPSNGEKNDMLVGGRMIEDTFNYTRLVRQYTTNYVVAGGGVLQKHNCTAWANLFTADGVSNEPGIPPSAGFQKLYQLCVHRTTRFQLLLPTVQLMIPVMSWNTEKRLAFRWTLSGTADQSTSYVVPAITMLLMGKDGKIQQAWDFWDTHLLPPSVGANFN